MSFSKGGSLSTPEWGTVDQPLSGESIPRIAAVIPALNEAPSIARVVEGLFSQVPLWLHRIIVVDNGSDDETGERARRAGAEVIREERRGYGYA